VAVGLMASTSLAGISVLTGTNPCDVHAHGGEAVATAAPPCRARVAARLACHGGDAFELGGACVGAAPGAAAAGTGGEALEPSPWLPSPPRSWPAGGAGLPSPRRHGQGRTVSRPPTRGGRYFIYRPPRVCKPFNLQSTAEIKQGRPSTGGTLTGPSA